MKTQDPNITHPLRQKDVVEKIGNIHGVDFTPYKFQAVAWKYGLKEKQEYCWKSKVGVLTQYSLDVVAWIKRLTKSDIEGALKDYRDHLRSKQKRDKT